MDLAGELRRLDALISSGSFVEARRLQSRLSEAIASDGRLEDSRLLRLLVARLLAVEGNHKESRELALAVFEDARASGDRICLARCHLFLNTLMLRSADYMGARRHAEAAVYFYSWEVDDPGLRGDSYNDLGLADKNLGFWDQAERSFRSALAAYAALNDPLRNLRASQNLAILLRKIGRIIEAENICREGLHLAGEIGIPLIASRYALELGNISVIRRDHGECERYLGIASAIAGDNGYDRETVLVDEVRGDVLLETGDAVGALKAYSTGLDKVRNLSSHSDLEYELLRRAAQAVLALGDCAKARGLLGKALGLSRRADDKYEYSICLRVLGEIELREGTKGTGIKHLRESVELLSGLSLWGHALAASEAALGKVLMECDSDLDIVCGREHMFAARRIYSNLGVSAAVREIDEIISRTGPDLESNSGGGASVRGRVVTEDIDGSLDLGRYGIITADARIVGDLARWGDTDLRVLIEGETGVGKEMVARAMHAMSRRREERFVAVDCGAVSETLAESELFGHAKGSFTGSVRDRAGLIEEANGGTILLDEVGELSEALQSKMLRVLEDGVVRRVGENRTRPVDVRVLSATTKDLSAEVERGRFRRDLYYRLKGVVVRIPSLRERRADVGLLLDHFLELYKERAGKCVRLSDKARRALLEYDWPGNVRELRHVVEALVVSARDEELVSEGEATEFLEASGSGVRHSLCVDRIEEREITRVLDACGGNKAEAARLLGISRKTLYQRIKDLPKE